MLVKQMGLESVYTRKYLPTLVFFSIVFILELSCSVEVSINNVLKEANLVETSTSKHGLHSRRSRSAGAGIGGGRGSGIR